MISFRPCVILHFLAMWVKYLHAWPASCSCYSPHSMWHLVPLISPLSCDQSLIVAEVTIFTDSSALLKLCPDPVSKPRQAWIGRPSFSPPKQSCLSATRMSDLASMSNASNRAVEETQWPEDPRAGQTFVLTAHCNQAMPMSDGT